MFRFDEGVDVTEKLVTKIVDSFLKNESKRFERLNAYYNVDNKILKRGMPPEKPNNKIAHGFAKYITNMATAFFMGEGLRLEIEDEIHKEKLTEVLNRNNISDVNFEIAKEMSKCGIAFEILYMNEKSEIRFKKFAAHEVIPVYSTSVSEFLLFAIRIWESRDFAKKDKTVYFAEVYTDREIITFSREDLDKRFKRQGASPHQFNDVPVIVYRNNEEQKGDYEDVITLIDAYDKAQSDTANDFEYFTDAYLVVVGADEIISANEKENEDDKRNPLKTLKNERILCLEEKGQAEWLIKQVNDTAVENFKNRIYDDIFFLSQVPALTDKSFAGNLSGVAIRYKLIGLEQLATMKENKFLPAYMKKLRMITSQLNTKTNSGFDAHAIEILFDRNMTDNVKELSEIVYDLSNIVSRETLLKQLPFIEDAAEEMKRIRSEKVQEDDYDRIGNIDSEKVNSYVANE